MITIDSRKGSAEFIKLIPNSSLATLEYADFAFFGRGPDAMPWYIGIERKTISDFLGSMATGRFTGHQLPGLLASYNVVYLIIEGLVRYELTNGLTKQRRGSAWCTIEHGNRRYGANEVLGYQNTLSLKTGVITWRSMSKRETAQHVISLYNWWNKKDYDAHHSHLGKRGTTVSLTKQSLLRRIASELPTIGWSKSRAVEDHFSSVQAMVNATVEQWEQIEGIGKTIAKKVVESLK